MTRHQHPLPDEELTLDDPELTKLFAAYDAKYEEKEKVKVKDRKSRKADKEKKKRKKEEEEEEEDEPKTPPPRPTPSSPPPPPKKKAKTEIKHRGGPARRPLEEDEAKIILNSFDRSKPLEARNHALILFMLRSGYRISEILKIQCKDVYDFAIRRMRQTVTVSSKNMKGSGHTKKDKTCKKKKLPKARHITLDDDSKKVLQPLCADAKPNDFLFSHLGQRSKPLTRIRVWQIIKQVASDNGIDADLLGCHSMRKHLAMWVWEKSEHDLSAVAKALGQQNLSSTSAYIDTRKKQVEDILKQRPSLL